MRLGILSDTHGLLRPEARAALEDTDLIIHAGDIGSPEVLTGLHALAPVVAVRGNVDTGAWAEAIPEREFVEAAGVLIHVLHVVQELDFDPRAAGIGVVVSGHSHRPTIEKRDGVLFLNPGSAGPRRFRLPVVLARLVIDTTGVQAELVDLLP